MGKPKRKRWVCPRCDGAVLAPSRPRRDDARRYCLACTKTTGRLVERECPALERERERKAVKRAQLRKAEIERKRTSPHAIAERWFRRIVRLRCWRDEAKLCALRTVRVSSRTHYSSGHAQLLGNTPSSFVGGEIVITIGNEWRFAIATLLHEVAHVVAVQRGDSGHGDIWRGCYAGAAAALCGDHWLPPAPADLDHTWALDIHVAERVALLLESEDHPNKRK